MAVTSFDKSRLIDSGMSPCVDQSMMLHGKHLVHRFQAGAAVCLFEYPGRHGPSIMDIEQRLV